MSWPEPQPGLVISYSYLWRSEYLNGQENGLKDRPCIIFSVHSNDDDEKVVYVLPITHSPPRSSDDAIEIPPDLKRRLGLDHERSWVDITEWNQFIWPGYDLRRAPSASGAYGFLTDGFWASLKAAIKERVLSSAILPVSRT
jgi:hypothetical protein